MSRNLRAFLSANPVLKGYVFAFLATLGMANVYIFSKAAMNELSVIQFGFFWFGLALSWGTAYLVVSGRIYRIRELDRKSKKLLVIIGLLELIAASSLFLSIRMVENPAVVSFLSNMTPIFVTILGIGFLRERFNMIEAIGIIFTISGAIMISYTGQSSLKEIFISGTGLILLSSLFSSFAIILSKYRIQKIDPSILMVNRISYLFFFSVLLMLLTGQSLTISATALFNVAVGSLLGPFLTALAQYSALKYIEASRVMIVQSTRGLFVAAGAIIYLSILPAGNQVIGGSITIAGVIIVASGKRALDAVRRKK